MLFRWEPEAAHELAFRLLPMLTVNPFAMAALGAARVSAPTRVWGLTFPNPVGLAAGFDKNALLLSVWGKLGFGFVEIGAVTPRPQIGSPKPRLFRLPLDEALINRMGFNNDGLAAIAKRLEKRPTDIIIGVNLGKNKDTPNENAPADYLQCFETLHSLADYFVVNVSSPNTPGLRALQEKETLYKIVSELQNHNAARGAKPLLVKIAPDLNAFELDDVLSVIEATNLTGAVATNTTLSRDGLQTPRAEVERIGAGGLSGPPLKKRADEIIKIFTEAGVSTVGVGGIASVADAQAKFDLGVELIQLYTGFVYHGPALIRQIAENAKLRLLKK